MPRVKIGPAVSDGETLAVGQLRNRWQTVFGRRSPPHLPRHLLFRVLAYRLQADHLGDLDGECRRLLDHSGSPEEAGQRAAELGRRTAELRPGAVLGREWKGRMPHQEIDGEMRLTKHKESLHHARNTHTHHPQS